MPDETKALRRRIAELEKQLADRELQGLCASRDQIDAILSSVDDGLIVTDPQGHIVLMNPGAERLLSLRASTYMGHPVEEIFSHTTAQQPNIAPWLKQNLGKVIKIEYEVGPLGEKGILQVKALPILACSGEKDGMIFVLQNVTREHHLIQEKNDFMSTAAHELRSPLATILGFAELLLGDSDFPEEERRDFARYIYEKAEALSTLVDELLDLSRIESGKGLSLEKVTLPLAELVTKAVEEAQKGTDSHPMELALPEEPLETLGDPQRLARALDNLLSNAIKYSPSGGTIRVCLSHAPSHHLISIEDRGIGMTPEQKAQAFDKFYRAETLDAGIRGSGLGLNIVKHIVEAHGGEVWVESEYGRGTTVTFTLPHCTAEEPDTCGQPSMGISC